MVFMARKGNKRHLKSLHSSNYYAISKKHDKYTTKAKAGRFDKKSDIPLLLFIRGKLGLGTNRSEAIKIIKQGLVKVNNKQVLDFKFPIGLNDIVSIDKLGKNYRISIDKKAHFAFTEIEKNAAASRICKVIRKYKVKNDTLMISLHDGTNIKGTKEIKVNDSVVIDSNKKINKLLPLKKGAKCFVMNGVHVGSTGEIDNIKELQDKKQVIIKDNSGIFETSLKNIIVIE